MTLDAQPVSTGDPIAWILGDDVGMSSKTIWAHMMGYPPHHPMSPYDPDDFSRCWRLLHVMPSWRARIGEMAQHGMVWARFADAWGELEALYLAEVGDSWPPPRKRAERLYARMKEVRGV